MYIALLVALTLINAFFAAAEMALVSVNKTKMKIIAEDTSDGDAKAEKVLLLLEEPNTFLSTIQVVITFAGFLSSAFASYNLSDGIVRLFMRWGIAINPEVAVIIVTVILSYFSLVFGELFPKRLAMIYAEKFALKSVGIVIFFKKIFTPFVKLLSASVSGLMKLFGQNKKEEEAQYAQEEIMDLLDVAQEQEEIDESGKEMIKSIFDFNDSYVYEAMIPRPDVYMVDINEPVKAFIDELLETKHARVPVYNEDSDDIIGILYLKDLVIEAKDKGYDNIDIRSLLKEPVYIPENKKLTDALTDLQKKKTKMALVIDEYGGFSGILTMEDIIEEIVGDIVDEEDTEQIRIKKLEDGSYIIDGLYDLEDLSEELGIEFRDESENSETIAGFLTTLTGEVPDEETSIGKEVSYENCIFTIMEVKDRRIEKIGLKINNSTENI